MSHINIEMVEFPSNKANVITLHIAFRDNTAGSANNRGKSTDENYSRGDREGGRGRGRGRGRGEGRGRGGPGREDRHSRQAQTYVPHSLSSPTLITNLLPHSDSEKQVSQGWGSTKGESEWTDEQAGEAIAKAEEKDGFDTNPDAPIDADGEHLASTKENDASAAELEPEDNTMSYSDYLAKVAAEKLDLGAPAARKPNEGKTDKKWAAAKPLQKEEEDTYIAGAGSKAKRERQRKEKTTLDIDQRYVEPPQGGRGGREGGRGGARGRGGDRERGGERGRGAGRGRGDGFRGPRRGGPGASAGAVDVADKSAFPSLGGSGSS